MNEMDEIVEMYAEWIKRSGEINPIVVESYAKFTHSKSLWSELQKVKAPEAILQPAYETMKAKFLQLRLLVKEDLISRMN